MRRAYEEDERIYGYVKQYQKGCIRVRVDLPDYTDLQQVKYDTIGPAFTENRGRIAERYAVPHGKLVITTTYEDANL